MAATSLGVGHQGVQIRFDGSESSSLKAFGVVDAAPSGLEAGCVLRKDGQVELVGHPLAGLRLVPGG